MSKTAEERTALSRLGGISRWVNVDDRAAELAKAREGLWERFLREANPDGTLPEHIALQRAESLRKQHFARLSLLAVQKRRQNREAREAAARAAELDAAAELEAELETGTHDASVAPASRRRGRKTSTAA